MSCSFLCRNGVADLMDTPKMNQYFLSAKLEPNTKNEILLFETSPAVVLNIALVLSQTINPPRENINLV